MTQYLKRDPHKWQTSERGGSSYFVSLDVAEDMSLAAGSSRQTKLNKAFLGTQRQVSGKFLNVYPKSPLLTHNK